MAVVMFAEIKLRYAIVKPSWDKARDQSTACYRSEKGENMN
jgi:hypothetical protein